MKKNNGCLGDIPFNSKNKKHVEAFKKFYMDYQFGDDDAFFGDDDTFVDFLKTIGFDDNQENRIKIITNLNRINVDISCMFLNNLDSFDFSVFCNHEYIQMFSSIRCKYCGKIK